MRKLAFLATLTVLLLVAPKRSVAACGTTFPSDATIQAAIAAAYYTTTNPRANVPCKMDADVGLFTFTLLGSAPPSVRIADMVITNPISNTAPVCYWVRIEEFQAQASCNPVSGACSEDLLQYFPWERSPADTDECSVANMQCTVFSGSLLAGDVDQVSFGSLTNMNLFKVTVFYDFDSGTVNAPPLVDAVNYIATTQSATPFTYFQVHRDNCR
jgi:hypothetical protein